jgi:hypothetical protein
MIVVEGSRRIIAPIARKKLNNSRRLLNFGFDIGMSSEI